MTKKLFTLFTLCLLTTIAAWGEEATFQFNSIYSDITGNSTQDLDGVVIEPSTGSGIKATFKKESGSNSPKYYANGAAVRFYSANTLTLDAGSKQISSVTITFPSSTYSGYFYYDCTISSGVKSYGGPNSTDGNIVVIQGVSQAGAIVTGQTLGMGKKEKTMEQGYMFFGLGLFLGAISAAFIMLSSDLIISTYKNVSDEAVNIAHELMLAISIIIIFQGTNSIMTKGVLRGGGDTRMLMLTDNIFLWVLAIPLGLLGGFVLKVSPFWIYIFLKSDQIVKTVWAYLRLRSGKWIKKISTGRN